MPVYEYECKECDKVFEIQQKIADKPLTSCPQCNGSVKKLISLNSFQLKGGGWYADGYASAGSTASASTAEAAPAAPPCQTGTGCASCPAAAGGK